jgi:PleD family two-component response regulator
LILVAAPLVASALKRADQALYRAKRGGSNRVVPDPA